MYHTHVCIYVYHDGVRPSQRISICLFVYIHTQTHVCVCVCVYFFKDTCTYLNFVISYIL
jgi:hypothetical protein